MELWTIVSRVGGDAIVVPLISSVLSFVQRVYDPTLALFREQIIRNAVYFISTNAQRLLATAPAVSETVLLFLERCTLLSPSDTALLAIAGLRHCGTGALRTRVQLFLRHIADESGVQVLAQAAKEELTANK